MCKEKSKNILNSYITWNPTETQSYTQGKKVGETMLQDTWKYICSSLPHRINFCPGTNSKIKLLFKVSVLSQTCNSWCLYFRHGPTLLVTGYLSSAAPRARVCQPVSLSLSMDTDRSDPYFLILSTFSWSSPLLPSTLLLYFPGLCLPPGLSNLHVHVRPLPSSLSKASVCSPQLSC